MKRALPPWAVAVLDRNLKTDVVYPTHANVVAILQHDPNYGVHRIWYDEFLDLVFLANSPTREWRDDDDMRVAVEIEDGFGIRGLNLHNVRAAVNYVARQRTRHVVRDWFTSLTWDGVPRIAHAFSDYWGAAEDEYTFAASRNFCVGIAARILLPGCKLDTMPVFEGPQGIKKSSALQVLGGPWHATAHESVTSKDFYQGMRGKLIIEVAEMQSFTRAEVNAVKTMMSSPIDHYRPSYGHRVVAYPRQCVFAGTTNADDWGDDSTGLRRFLPIRCGVIRLDLLATAREQLFAEAVDAVRAGQSWWEMPSSTLAIQASRQFHDEWTATILGWCDRQLTDDGVRIRDILIEALKLPESAHDKRLQMRVADILRKHGWAKPLTGGGNKRTSEGVAKVWLKQDSGGGNIF